MESNKGSFRGSWSLLSGSFCTHHPPSSAGLVNRIRGILFMNSSGRGRKKLSTISRWCHLNNLSMSARLDLSTWASVSGGFNFRYFFSPTENLGKWSQFDFLHIFQVGCEKPPTFTLGCFWFQKIMIFPPLASQNCSTYGSWKRWEFQMSKCQKHRKFPSNKKSINIP